MTTLARRCGECSHVFTVTVPDRATSVSCPSCGTVLPKLSPSRPRSFPIGALITILSIVAVGAGIGALYVTKDQRDATPTSKPTFKPGAVAPGENLPDPAPPPPGLRPMPGGPPGGPPGGGGNRPKRPQAAQPDLNNAEKIYSNRAEAG